MRIRDWDVIGIFMLVACFLSVIGWVQFRHVSKMRSERKREQTERDIVQSLPSFLKGGLMKSGDSLYLRTDDGKIYKLEEQ